MNSRLLAMSLALSVAGVAQAQFTTYFRTANSGSGTTPFRVPATTGVLGSAHVRLNASGELIGYLSNTSGQFQIFRGTEGAGSVVYTDPTGELISGLLNLNNSGQVVFSYNSFGPGGIYSMSTANVVSALTTNLPLGNSSWGSTTLNNAGRVAWRGAFGSNDFWVNLSANGSAATIVAIEGQTVSTTSGSTTISFLYTPHLNDLNRVYGAVGLGAVATVAEVRSFALDGSSETLLGLGNAVAYGFDFNAMSNLLSVNNSGDVAFFGRVGTEWGLYRRDANATVTKLAASVAGTIVGTSDFINFPPVINDNRVVAFRARDGRAGESNRRGVYVALPDGTVNRILAEGDVFNDSSTGTPIRIGWDATFSSSAFYSQPSINSQNRVAVLAVATTPSNLAQRIGGLGLVSEPVLPVGTSFSGTITFLDWVGGDRAYTLELRDAVTNNLLQSAGFTSSGSTGNYSFVSTLTSPSSVKLTVKPAGSLRSTTLLTLGGAAQTANFSIRPGDVDGSGEVDAADIDAVIADFGGGAGLSDQDGSGEVDAADIDLVIARFGSVDE